jgi:hydroxymethylpyrimidine/phosphomethylpyrimidine kinase
MDPATERTAVMAHLEKAVSLLGNAISPHLLPPGGAQIGYAIRGARDANGIAAVSGKITGAGKAAGPGSFGADAEIARVILTIMKFDPGRRSAALVRYSDRALDVLENDLFLECAAWDPARAPPGISSMDWGIASCCREDVPDVIYPEAGRQTDAKIVLTGDDPATVANNIIICSNRI